MEVENTPRKLAKRYDKEYMKEYLKQYRELHPEYNKKYYEKHKEKMIEQIKSKLCEKVQCDCGKMIMRGYIKKHMVTPLHNKLMNKK